MDGRKGFAIGVCVLIVLGIIAAIVAGALTNWYGLARQATTAAAAAATTAAPDPGTAVPDATAAPSPAPFVVAPFLDSSGSDIGQPLQGVADVNSCAALCTGSCAGVAYGPSSQQCWLKTSIGNVSRTGNDAAKRVLAAPSLASSITAPGVLPPGRALVSPAGKYAVLMQTDFNLVVYNLTTNTAVWASNTSTATPGLVVDGNGNLSLSDSLRNTVWSALQAGRDPAGSPTGYNLVMQDDGNLVNYRLTSPASVVWASNSAGK